MKFFRKNCRTIFFLMAIYVLSSLSILTVSGMLTGPIIGGDEYLYMNLAKSIHMEHRYISGAQYNPLYPFITSFFYYLDRDIVYKAIKIFNACIFSSVIFPLHILCRKVLKSKSMAYFLSCGFAFFPWKVVTTTVWAEPLFYPLLAWCMLLLYCYFEKESKKTLVLLGILAGLLFLAKQSGLLFVAAVCCTLAIKAIIEKRNNIKAIAAFLFPAASIVVLWTIYRKFLGQGGALGYETEIGNIRDNLLNIKDLLYTLLYNISYYTLATFIIVGALFIYSLIAIKKFDFKNQLFIINCFMLTGFIMILSAFHYIGLNAPYGRYQTSVLPYIFIIAVMVLENTECIHRFKLFIASGILTLICVIFNPFYSSVSVKGYFTQMDLSVWTKFLIDGNLPFSYGSSEEATQIISSRYLPISIVLLYFALSTIFILLIHKKRAGKIILVGYMTIICVCTFSSHYAMTERLASIGTPVNDTYRYLAENNISYENVYKSMPEIGNVNLDSVWDDNLHLPGKKEIERKSIIPICDVLTLMTDNISQFDFGGEKTPEKEGYYIIKAPWVIGNYYDASSGMPGFDGESTYVDSQSTIGSVYDENMADEILADGIYGVTENRFMLKKPEGSYTLKLAANTELMQNLIEVNFSVYVNGELYGKMSTGKQQICIENFKNKSDNLEIKLIPDQGACWLLCGMEIIPEKETQYNNVYIIDKKENEQAVEQMKQDTFPGLDKKFSNDAYVIYYKQ